MLNSVSFTESLSTVYNRQHYMQAYIFALIVLSLVIRCYCLGMNTLLVEEAYYWNYGQHLDFGYLDHPPMVALLIRASVEMFGMHEWAVRIPALLCWLGTCWFGLKLTNLIARGAGIYTLLLLSLLPFFFLQSMVITPDLPLLLCWSATLYALYRALVLEEARYWLFAGLSMGLGLLSKYTIVLLGPAALFYMLFVPNARAWFFRREPYLAIGIALLVFTPVIYWNATHNWASFMFQSARRVHDSYAFSLHHLLGLLLLFLTPIGTQGLIRLFKKDAHKAYAIDHDAKRFMQWFFMTPLLVFATFSVTHSIKFNWIGPSLLAIIPWLSACFFRASVTIKKAGVSTALVLLVVFGCFTGIMISGSPKEIHHVLLGKFIAWDALTQQVHEAAERIEKETHEKPILIPLDRYNIASELAFYQTKAVAQDTYQNMYAVHGSHVFGNESLMYRYWSHDAILPGKVALLISDELWYFNNPEIKARAFALSPVNVIWSVSQGLAVPIRPYYYQVVRFKANK